ncbi:MAG: hypothetical protein KAT46_04540 [Deltaproteobacteria bacterium]|nr:hypothetical protein [Deltaproteobacteria bacterium]
MNKKQKATRGKRITERNLELRDKLWPDIDSEALWHRNQNTGFVTLPRLMPLFALVMDDLACGQPPSKVYYSLWCRDFDTSLIEIKHEKEMAHEAGFSSERAVSTWRTRIKKLEELGFIKVQSGRGDDYRYILILNPYFVIKELKKKGQITDDVFNDLFARAQEVGAESDLESEEG